MNIKLLLLIISFFASIPASAGIILTKCRSKSAHNTPSSSNTISIDSLTSDDIILTPVPGALRINHGKECKTIPIADLLKNNGRIDLQHDSMQLDPIDMDNIAQKAGIDPKIASNKNTQSDNGNSSDNDDKGDSKTNTDPNQFSTEQQQGPVSQKLKELENNGVTSTEIPGVGQLFAFSMQNKHGNNSPTSDKDDSKIKSDSQKLKEIEDAAKAQAAYNELMKGAHKDASTKKKIKNQAAKQQQRARNGKDTQHWENQMKRRAENNDPKKQDAKKNNLRNQIQAALYSNNSKRRNWALAQMLKQEVSQNTAPSIQLPMAPAPMSTQNPQLVPTPQPATTQLSSSASTQEPLQERAARIARARAAGVEEA